MILPMRRKRERFGIDHGPRLEWPRHEKWVRGHRCSVPGCQSGPVQFAHIRNAANSSKDVKPHSAFGYPLCLVHHAEEHGGSKTFARKYGINPYALAAWFMRHSPDLGMRETFYQLPAHVQRPLLEAA